MKISALEQFLKNVDLASCQSSQVLEKFLLYAKLVSDPLNVFRYMKEKAICTHFPLFWYAMSQYLTAVGDYRNAFLCLKQAQNRMTMDENDQSYKIINTSVKAQTYREQIFNEIRKCPPGKRRSSSEFILMSEPFEQVYGGEQEKYQTLFNLLQTKYTLIRTQKERAFQQKNQGKPKSWLHEIYTNQDNKAMQIIQQTLKMHSDEKSIPTSSVARKDTSNENQDRLFRSVNTPFKRRDPMRMVKTLDSVEMLKRKRKSQDATKNRKFFNSGSDQLSENFDEDELSNDEQDSEILINTMPVGRTFDKKKKQVKFEKQQGVSIKIEKPRDNNHIPNEDDSIDISRKTVRSNKGILKNKSVEKKETRVPVFSQITERSLKIKKTEENQI